MENNTAVGGLNCPYLSFFGWMIGPKNSSKQSLTRGSAARGDNRSVRSDRLEQAVWDEIRTLLEDPGRVAAEYQRRLDQARENPGEARDADLERRIPALRRGIGRLIDGYAERLIDRDEFEPRIDGMRQRLAHLEADRQRRLADAETEQNLTLLVGRLDEFVERVHGGLDELD